MLCVENVSLAVLLVREIFFVTFILVEICYFSMIYLEIMFILIVWLAKIGISYTTNFYPSYLFAFCFLNFLYKYILLTNCVPN